MHEHSHPDPYLDSKQLKRGAVIAVNPDGWNWGAGEMSDPMFRIIKLPNVDEAAGRSFMGAEIPTTPPEPMTNDVLLLHQFTFDLNHPALPEHVTGYLADDSRTDHAITFNMSVDQFLRLKKKRQSLVDPAYIGETPTIIG